MPEQNSSKAYEGPLFCWQSNEYVSINSESDCNIERKVAAVRSIWLELETTAEEKVRDLSAIKLENASLRQTNAELCSKLIRLHEEMDRRTQASKVRKFQLSNLCKRHKFKATEIEL